jgi:D-beta-D-heptose 7-phosphate kinase/D-beta-D-heptose 1-phosphate adenosyltransferase
LVIGDVMLDCYYWGDANRISPEAPVPVVDLTEVTYVLGGAANVAANVVSLGQDCILMGVIGKDEEAVVLTRLLRDLGVTDYLVVEKDRPTTTKSRVVAGGQHLLRLDNEDTSPLYDASDNKMRSRMATVMKDVSVIVISDYAKGSVSEDMAAYAIRLGIKYHIPVFVDPKGTEWAKYRNAFCVTPNKKEFIEFFNYDFNSEISTIEEIIAVAPEVVEVFDLNYLCVTLGDGGILVADKEVNIYPAEKAEVIDVSGAGDTVIASFAVDAAGIEDPLAVDMKWAAKFANRTAAVAVSKLGTVAVAFYEVEYD